VSPIGGCGGWSVVGAALLSWAAPVRLSWEGALSEEEPLSWEALPREEAHLRVEWKAPLREEIPP
jgi:hypothetical protein